MKNMKKSQYNTPREKTLDRIDLAKLHVFLATRLWTFAINYTMISQSPNYIVIKRISQSTRAK